MYSKDLMTDSTAIGLKGRDLLKLLDLKIEEIEKILELTSILKLERKEGIPHPLLTGKNLGMIFMKSSTRTRVSFEASMYQLGGSALNLEPGMMQLTRGETLIDTAKVLSRYLEGIMIRTYDQEEVEILAKYAQVPVINGLTDLFHPCQVLGDLFTLKEKLGNLAGKSICYVGDGNNVANSLMIGTAMTGMNIYLNTPNGYEPDSDITEKASKIASSTGGSVNVSNQPEQGISRADVIYTDVWTSMGQDDEFDIRLEVFPPFQVKSDLVNKGKSDVLIMHCLPAHRGEEITDEVMDGPNSVVFDQAENRLHVQKAILCLLMR